MKRLIMFLPLILMGETFFTNSLDKRKISANIAQSTLMYAVHHPLHSFDSKSGQFRCVAAFNSETQEIEAIAVQAAVLSFDSGNSNRDSHMIEAIEGLKFPNVTFSSDQLEYGVNGVLANGFLIFHGQKIPMKIRAKQVVVEDILKLKGDFIVNMTEFGVDPPSILGMSTDEEIHVKFEMVFDLK